MPLMARKKKPTPKSSWPAKLKQLRSQWGKDGKLATQSFAAERIGVTLRSWASWERGEREPLQPIQMLIDCLMKNG